MREPRVTLTISYWQSVPVSITTSYPLVSETVVDPHPTLIEAVRAAGFSYRITETIERDIECRTFGHTEIAAPPGADDE